MHLLWLGDNRTASRHSLQDWKERLQNFKIFDHDPEIRHIRACAVLDMGGAGCGHGWGWLSPRRGMAEKEVCQRVYVMRHGERLDSIDRQWVKRAVRPYDTPLSRHGEQEAMRLVKQRLANKVYISG